MSVDEVMERIDGMTKGNNGIVVKAKALAIMDHGMPERIIPEKVVRKGEGGEELVERVFDELFPGNYNNPRRWVTLIRELFVRNEFTLANKLAECPVGSGLAKNILELWSCWKRDHDRRRDREYLLRMKNMIP